MVHHSGGCWSTCFLSLSSSASIQRSTFIRHTYTHTSAPKPVTIRNWAKCDRRQMADTQQPIHAESLFLSHLEQQAKAEWPLAHTHKPVNRPKKHTPFPSFLHRMWNLKRNTHTGAGVSTTWENLAPSTCCAVQEAWHIASISALCAAHVAAAVAI